MTERSFPAGATNGRWTGDAATYYGIHQRVRRALGRASEYPCNECGNPAAHWSYDHADPAERQSDDGAYSLSVDHYVPRCVSCHKKLDLSLKPQKPDTPIDLDAVRRLRAQGVGVRSIAHRLGTGRARIERALGELGLPRRRQRKVRNPRCGQQMRPWRGEVNLCARPQGHTGKHEASERLKTSRCTEAGEAA